MREFTTKELLRFVPIDLNGCVELKHRTGEDVPCDVRFDWGEYETHYWRCHHGCWRHGSLQIFESFGRVRSSWYLGLGDEYASKEFKL